MILAKNRPEARAKEMRFAVRSVTTKAHHFVADSALPVGISNVRVVQPSIQEW